MTFFEPLDIVRPEIRISTLWTFQLSSLIISTFSWSSMSRFSVIHNQEGAD